MRTFIALGFAMLGAPAWADDAELLTRGPWSCVVEDKAARPGAPAMTLTVTMHLSADGELLTLASGSIQTGTELREIGMELRGRWRTAGRRLHIEEPRAQATQLTVNGRPAPEDLAALNEILAKQPPGSLAGITEIEELTSNRLKLESPTTWASCQRSLGAGA